MSILVTHPGRQHVHQLVHALERAGMLLQFWTGVPSAAVEAKSKPYGLVAQLSPQPVLDVPPERVRHFFVAPVVRRLARYLCSPAEAVRWGHCADGWFDRWCAWRLRRQRLEARVVVAYENAALHTFREARAKGMKTVLDAASYHHAWQDQAFGDYVETEAVHRQINERKEAEMALADHVLTVSELARQSYIDGGVPAERVHAVPVGCDLERFHVAPPSGGSALQASARPFTFIFAGHASHRKGIDLLLHAAHTLNEEGRDARVWVAGGASPGIDWASALNVERLGRLPQTELADRFRAADCLVLPSRHDSFGMVVVEAMAAGLPVIVTDHVGAKQAVVEETSGWVIPAEDGHALITRMRWCVEHPSEVRAMHEAARASAETYSWAGYHERVVACLRAVTGL